MSNLEHTNMQHFEVPRESGINETNRTNLEFGNSTAESNESNSISSEQKELNESQSGQEIAEQKHLETKEHVLEHYGYTMTQAQKQRLENPESKNNLKVIPSEEYSRIYKKPENVKGHYDNEGHIVIREENDVATKHVAVHETMHYASYQENTQCGNLRENRCGLRESTLKDGWVIEDKNRAINEGVTEMYTGRELWETGEKEGMNAYPESRLWARRMETLVGREKLERAYFGGDLEPLKNEVNRLSKSEDGWERFSGNVNTLEYVRGNDTDDYVRRAIATRELNEQYAVMTATWSEIREAE